MVLAVGVMEGVGVPLDVAIGVRVNELVTDAVAELVLELVGVVVVETVPVVVGVTLVEGEQLGVAEWEGDAEGDTAVRRRTRLPYSSLKMTVRAPGDTHSPNGPFTRANRESPPSPLKPEIPSPPTTTAVGTLPLSAARRMRLVTRSQIQMNPSPSSATPVGSDSGLTPDMLSCRVETTFCELLALMDSTRIAWLRASAMNTVVDVIPAAVASTTRPCMPLNLADNASTGELSGVPATPVPAIV